MPKMNYTNYDSKLNKEIALNENHEYKHKKDRAAEGVKSDMLHVLGSGFLDPILTLDSSTEWDLDNLSSKTNKLSIIYSGEDGQ